MTQQSSPDRRIVDIASREDFRLACVADYLPPHNTLICTVPGLSELECKTVQNGGSVRVAPDED
jgi:hypothetical protein